MKQKPIIGITMFQEKNEKGIYDSINHDYVNAVLLAGGIPLLLSSTEIGVAKDYINILDGILFSGGEDIAPSFFNEEPSLHLGSVCHSRDLAELTMFHEALNKKIPILGICRGLQLINVALGGSLYQDIDTEVKDILGHHPKTNLRNQIHHTVEVKEGTVLHKICGKTQIATNSFHHQAINKLGDNLIISAVSKDGIIEGIESKTMNEQFIFALQCHPENLIYTNSAFLDIFKTFVNKCQK